MKYRAQLERTAHRIWSDKGWISTLLLPLSWLVHLFIQRKAARYGRHPDRVWKSNVPVVIVGNIYIGGTGKTPVVMALVKELEQRGWSPGVISRGYGVNIGEHARTGQGDLDPSQFGDEPTLIARATQVPVAVHPSRPKAAQALLAHYPRIDLIVADDGLQHLALGRDAEIIVQDGRGIGNGRLLPAGPLREPASRLSRVDVVITHNSTPCQTGDCAPSPATPHTAARCITTARSAGPVKVNMTLIPREAVHVSTGRRVPWDQWQASHRDTPVSAVAAIGNPDRFFSMLRGEELSIIETLGLPDHTTYDSMSFDTIKTAIILITTKDAVKCAKLNDERLWAVSVSPHFSNNCWLDRLHETLLDAERRKAL